MYIRIKNIFTAILILIMAMNPLISFSQTQGNSLYGRLGGVYSIAAVVDDFVDRLLADPVITENKNVVHSIEKITKPGLKYQITELLCQAAGGPQKYNGRPMKESHQGLNITEVEWQSMMKDFLVTLGKFNIKGLEQNELLVIIGSTKADIVASAAAESAPSAVPPSPTGVPTQPAVPSIPDFSKPADLIPQIPAQPVVPPNPTAAPVAPSIPSIPNPVNLAPQVPTQPAVPSIPDFPKPADLIPQVPSPASAPTPSIPSIPNPVVPQIPSLPSANPSQGQPFGLPPETQKEASPNELPSLDLVKPNVPPPPSLDIAPLQDNVGDSVIPADDSGTGVDTLEQELPNPDDILTEPDLEPVE